ncbi:MAG: peptidase S10, partial [Pseudomonadota bacterium]
MRLLSIRTNLQRAAAALVLSAAPAALADGHMAENTAYDAAQLPDPVNFVTQHRGRFNGQNVSYRVEAGETYLRNEDGEPTGALFSFSYIKDDAGIDRPVTFIFNGGPGSASIWLHMGMFGPKRAVVASDADEDDGAAPYLMVDNPLAVLDVTDMVFIDPIGTGYSRPIGVGEGADFWSQEGDTASVADFIRIWVTKHKRWNAPKYIAGESFGTMRAAAVANELTNGTQNISLNGLMMISQALDYEGSTPVHDNFYSYVTYLPTLAAVARYHGKGPAEPADLDAYLEEVRDFAVNEYAPALLQGTMLAPAERARIRDKLATYTGLSPDYVETSNLRILTGRFNKELLRDQGLAVGGADGRYTVDDADDIAERPTI